MNEARSMVACPVHRRYVLVDIDGHILGTCSDCIREAADAQRLIEHGHVPGQLLLQGAN